MKASVASVALMATSTLALPFFGEMHVCAPSGYACQVENDCCKGMNCVFVNDNYDGGFCVKFTADPGNFGDAFDKKRDIGVIIGSTQPVPGRGHPPVEELDDDDIDINNRRRALEQTGVIIGSTQGGSSQPGIEEEEEEDVDINNRRQIGVLIGSTQGGSSQPGIEEEEEEDVDINNRRRALGQIGVLIGSTQGGPSQPGIEEEEEEDVDINN